jgi:tRNA (guanine-N7-)-methyltransferase
VTEARQRPALPPEHRPDHIRSFGTRRGHLTENQRDAIERLTPRFCVPFNPKQRFDFISVFGNDNPVTFEIGCGMGETTAKIALDNPGTNYLGCEVYPAGIGALLRRIEQADLENVRLVQHDAVEILQHAIAPDSLHRVHILFPDPWPKKRHHKRRLIQPAFVALLATRLQQGGTIHCATDWEPYAEQMLTVLQGNPDLVNDAGGAGQWLARPAWRPVTKFENRGLRRGYVVRDLSFTKRRTAGD